MQPISDKDFDKFFQDKLSAFEEKPSQAVWSGISKQLDNKKRRPFPVMWMAAASLAGVLAIGLWFSSQKEPMYLHGNGNPEIVKQTTDNELSNNPVRNSSVEAHVTSRVQNGKRVSSSVQRVVSIKEETTSVEIPVKERMTQQQQPEKVVIAAVSEPVQEEESRVTLPVETVAVAETDEEPESQNVKQNRIKSVGSLVNFVVGKVDKRKNKIIEFEDNDEGTKVSGINLGLLKFNPKE